MSLLDQPAKAGIGGEAAWTTEVSFVRGPAVGGRNGGLATELPRQAVPTGTETARPGLIQEAGEKTARASTTRSSAGRTSAGAGAGAFSPIERQVIKNKYLTE
jgi:hypothetical protein